MLLHSIPHSFFYFLWIPSHVGTNQNETVDTMSRNPAISSSPCKSLTPSEMLRVVKQSSLDDGNFITQSLSMTLPLCTFQSSHNSPSNPDTSTTRIYAEQTLSNLANSASGIIYFSPSPSSTSNRASRFIQLSFSSPFPHSLQSGPYFFFECAHLDNKRNTSYSELLRHHIPTPFSAANII